MKSDSPAHYMGREQAAKLGSRISIGLVLIMLLANGINVVSPQNQVVEESTELSNNPLLLSSRASNGDVDVPSLRNSDHWVYDGFFDVAGLVAGSGTGSNVQTLTGDLDMWVADIITTTTENKSSLAYKVSSTGTFSANGVNLNGYNGDLTVDYTGTDYYRVSDLATISTSMRLVVEFSTFGGIINIDVADLTVVNSYSPPREDYDFPLRVGEAWSSNYTTTTTWSGSSDYFTIPENSESSSSTSYAVVASGNPNVPYTGCNNAYNVSQYDSNGSVVAFKWWCPNVNSDAWRHFQDDIGLIIDFKLQSFSPQSRSLNIDVELEYPAWVLDGPLGSWVNVTDGSGSPVSGQSIEWRYEANENTSTLTTAANGSAYISFDSGNQTDPSPTLHDWASHGIIAWVSGSKKVGVDTITLDDSLVSLDYSPRSSGVSVQRTRDGSSITLDPSIGYNAIHGDELIFSVPVENRGILPGPSTELEVTAPDSSTSRTTVNPLGALGEQWIQISWTVPASQPLGTTTLYFEVDPDGLMVGDQNQSNDLGEFDIYIGALPIADIIQPLPTKTRTPVYFDATQSIDPDGGSVHCTFVVEVTAIANSTFEEDDCILENSWEDDGTFHVWLTITDDENDQDYTELDVEILNRAPYVNITTPHHAIPVEQSITFDASDSGDIDTLNDDAPVDLLWQPPTRSDGVSYECEEGMVSQLCTVTPMEEGIFTMRVTVEDDDGAFTTGDFNLVVTNIAPSDAQMSLWDGETELTDDRIPPIWQVDEDQLVTLKGAVHDSLNDMDSLTWGWQPDRDVDPAWTVETTGVTSEIDVSWTTSGTHIIAMEAVDDDGESSGVVNGWVEVMNVPPTVEPIGTQLPVGEDRDFTVTGEFSDTTSDLDSLQICWDVDFEVDLDENGDRMDDCDMVGATLVYHWSVSGNKSVRFHVTDDNGESAESIVNLTVVNLKPKAAAEAERLTLAVGDELIVWTNDTSDTASDMDLLRFSWDMDTSFDADDDGDTGNDLDMITTAGEPLRFVFTSEGTKNIRLTVSDEDKSSSIDLQIEVTPDTTSLLGWLDSNTAGISNQVMLLGLVLVSLLLLMGVSMVRGKSGRVEDDWLGGGPIYDESSPTLAPPTYAFAEAQAPSPDYGGNTMQGGLISPSPIQESVVSQSTDPPLPASGLPAGWTMEQWSHYGAKWLEENSQNISLEPVTEGGVSVSLGVTDPPSQNVDIAANLQTSSPYDDPTSSNEEYSLDWDL